LRRFFVYGTLLDRDVTSLVLGRRLPPAAFAPALLPRHRRRRAKGASYPVVVRAPGSEVSGAVISGLSARDVARLAAYEGPGYRIVMVGVSIAGRRETVSVFEPVFSRLQPSSEPWDLAPWQRRSKRAFVERLRRAISALPR
jgi:Gamma-glutamyl cyclotransferase, AIG2-like